MIIPTDAKKTFAESQHPHMTKTLNKMGIEETYLNIIKAIYDKLTINTIPNGEKLKGFLLISGVKQRHPLSLVSINIALEVLYIENT